MTILNRLGMAAFDTAKELPGLTGLAIFTLVSIAIVLGYWNFGTNVWIKLIMVPGWSLSMICAVHAAFVIDGRRVDG